MKEPLSNSSLNLLYEESILLLKKLISTPSFSKEEEETYKILTTFLSEKEVKFETLHYNIWAKNRYYDPQKPTILLNSHHDIVRPNEGYSVHPFDPKIIDDKLYGLGSNDAGGALVSLIFTFLYFYEEMNLKYNFVLLISAEEEISGSCGISSVIELIGNIDFAIVGEPTEMNMAISEKGLIVLDCESKGVASHAAHENPENAIVNALDDIKWFSSFKFPKKSSLLGEIKMSVTIISAGVQHNIIPDKCSFTVDIRTNECYSNQEIVEIIKQYIKSKVTPRSLRLNSSRISVENPFVKKGIEYGLSYYGSPTLSDQALMPFPSLKIGPGSSLRSHISNEFIYLFEIKKGIETYIKLLQQIN